MRKIWFIVLGLVLAGFTINALIPKSTKNVGEDPYKFYYYPRLNAYYDFQRGDFVYTLDGGRSWLRKTPSAASLPEKLSKKVMISGPVPDIWRYNDEHRANYKGIKSDHIKTDLTKRKPVRDPAPDKKTEEQIMPEASGGTSQSSAANGTSSKKVRPAAEQEWEDEMSQEAGRLFNDAQKQVKKEVTTLEEGWEEDTE